MAIFNTRNHNRIPLPHPTSPSANFTSHVLIQTEQGRLSDASIRFNRIVDRAHARWDDEYSFSSQRCTFKPLLYALLIVLVAFSLLAIVMGEAIQEAFPLVVEEGKFMNRKGGGGMNVTQESVRTGNRGGSNGDTLSFGVEEMNGRTALDDDDDVALFYHVDEYNYVKANSGVKEMPQVEKNHNNKSNTNYDVNGLDLTSNLREETLDSFSNLDSNPLTNATIGAEVVSAPESLADNSTSNATATIFMPVRPTNSTSNETLEGSEPPLPMSTRTIPTDNSKNSDQWLQ